MELKKYSSYAAIDRDLEILKLEKEISYQKLLVGLKATKDSVTPQNIISGFLAPYSEAVPIQLRSIFKTALPYVISFFMTRKSN